jgi:alkylation response protein AidB-like acyl-CoA dehydrogenase
MTTLTRPTATTDTLLEAVTALAPTVEARADEVESGRRIPRDLLDELISTGCFRMLLPERYGGLGADLGLASQVLRTLSRADGAVGWTVMIGSGVWLDLAGLPRETFDGLYRDGPDVMIAGVFNPSGVAERTDGGYRVSGRWAFASGSSHCEWFYGNCMEEVDGAPQLRTVVLPVDQVRVEDTWCSLGLRGTASHHVSIDGVVVPVERTFATFEEHSSVDAPVVDIPVPSLLALAVASVAIGIAGGALDDVVPLSGAKTPMLAAGVLATNATFQRDLASADTDLRAAEALIAAVADDTWSTVTSGDAVSLDQRARIRAAAVWATSRAVSVVRTAFVAAGGSAVYDDSRLQRRQRDIETLAQHFLVRPDTMTTAGAVLAGQEPDVPVF